MLVPQLRKQLESKGQSLPANFSDVLNELYGKSFKSSAPTLFLKPGSVLTRLPPGERGRQSPHCVYIRCCMIEQKAMTPEIVQVLTKGVFVTIALNELYILCDVITNTR